ncbi:hypothetical protein GCM10028778_16350 [Barrientosiimonas marina]|uniref:CBO0543 family protein n=1 Tax=Lentibacillus kimchii TaxID=1542911 RepID=A0ABW2UX59_9BACI
MKQQPSVSIQKLYDVKQQMFEANYERWVNDVLFTFNWWLLIILTLVVIFIWLKALDTSRLLEILFVGLCIGILATILDVTGDSLSFWTYGYKVVQIITPLNPVDLAVLPVAYMLIYQWFTKWKPYIWATIALAAIGTFVAEPVFELLGIYHLNTWKFIYSFPIYIAMGIGIKALTHKMMAIQRRARSTKQGEEDAT